MLGPEHELTLCAGMSLGGDYRRSGDLEQAERIWSQVLSAQRRTLGDDAPDTLRTLSNMGIVLAAQGRLSEAETCWTELLERRRRLKGEDHPDYLSSLGNLGVVLQDQGKLAQARSMMEKSVAADRRRLGDRHVDTLTSIVQMASLLKDMGELEAAEKLQRECYEGRLALGDEYANTLRAKAGLAAIMHARGERMESQRLISEALADQRRLLGESDPDTIGSLRMLGLMKRDEGAFAEAIEYEREALQLAREHLSNEPWSIGEILSQHGLTMIAAGRPEDALTALREGYELIEKTFGPLNPFALRAAKGLAELFASAHQREPNAGHDAEAASWSDRALGVVSDTAPLPKPSPGPGTKQ